ncbi:hypothetical protein K432DRAFT_350716 [Lepidopterella palustris CBS 459.81]|uniref:DUF1989 domain-containing protein n=1 Tax=Lepidopterella palustris CBS 459.81 TaxID=1314670 RepID=A0A8E2JGH0_9PEZI|nr:hypothetical protein K432DRAFT_350716 [Lepidopterella palustris CBS 459.81]
MQRQEQPPRPAYLPTSPSSPLHPPLALYNRIASTPLSSRLPLQTLTIPPRSGAAWEVPAGCIFRLSTPEGPQVGDLNIWNKHDPRERFWAARTRQLQGAHVREGDRLWSCLPFMRPLCGVVSDGCGLGDRGVGGNGEECERGGTTRWGGRCHDLLGTRCDPYVNQMLTDTSYDHHCHSNLVRAILPHRLTEFDVHDVLNVFQVTGLDANGRYFMEASPATKDSFIEFFAEQDLLCALSTCPGGDLSAWGWDMADEAKGGGEGKEGALKSMKDTCRPIKVEVWEIWEEVRGSVLEGWEKPKCPEYKGMHGMNVP